MQAELRAVVEQSRKTPEGSAPRVFIELWDDPLTTAGGSSFLDDVVSRAGGVNVAHGLSQPHPRVSAEQVIEWNPDVIVVAHMARGGNAAAQMAQRIGWSDIAAVRKGRIIRDMPPDLILRPGPRLIDGVKVLAQRLYGAPAGAESAASEAGQTCP
jgi:iron complex transport system substrate-binding protein